MCDLEDVFAYAGVLLCCCWMRPDETGSFAPSAEPKISTLQIWKSALYRLSNNKVENWTIGK